MIEIIKKITYSLISTFILFFLVSCSNANQIPDTLDIENDSVQNSQKEKVIKELEGNIQNESNYYFFNEEEGSKKVILNFKSNYTQEPINKVILYYDGSFVSDRVKIVDTSIHDTGIFVMELESYVPKFNEIKLITGQGTELYLKTGLYVFEKINIINNIPEEERWGIEEYNTNENISSFKFESKFTREKVGDSEYELSLPKLAIDELFIENKLEVKEDNNNLHLTAETNSSKEFNISSSYEILVIQKKTNSNQQYIMNSIIVAINP